MCVQRVSTLWRALVKLLLAHGAQVLARQVLEGLACVGQPVQMFSPQQPLLHVACVPLGGILQKQTVSGRESELVDYKGPTFLFLSPFSPKN